MRFGVKKYYSRLMLSIVALLMVSTARGQVEVLLEENWNSGTIDSAKWAVHNEPGVGDVTIVDLGGGDFACKISSTNFGPYLYSANNFPRGQRIRVQFLVWYADYPNPFPGASAIYGPWHLANDDHPRFTQEAAVGFWFNIFTWNENGEVNAGPGSPSIPALTQPYQDAFDKDHAVFLRATLDDSQGSILELSTNGGVTGEIVINTLGTGLSMNQNNWIGWGTFANDGTGEPKSIVVDDIRVERGPWLPLPATSPTPTPTPEPTPPPGAVQALLVVDVNTADSTGDTNVRNYLQNVLNFWVVQRHDEVVQASDADDKAIIVISSTVVSSNIGPMFRDTPVGVITWENALFDDFEITPDNSVTPDSNGALSGQTRIFVIDSAHPLAAGFSGDVGVNGSNEDFRWGVPSGAATGAAKVATLAGDSEKFTIIGYDTGSQMENSFIAPARRVGYFYGDTAAASSWNPDGQAMFRAAVEWATLEIPPPRSSIYYVQAGTVEEPHASDVPLIAHLQTELGYNVTVVNELDQTVEDALTHDLIFISASGGSGNTAPFIEDYRKSDVAFVMSELGSLVAGLFGFDAVGAATVDVQNTKILDNSHFITENFSVGEIVEIRTSADGVLVHINPGTSEATILAAANDGDDTQGTIVAMEVGQQFDDGEPTTARRAFLFLHSSHVYLENYTPAGVELVERVFQWALSEPPVPNPVDPEFWTVLE